MEPAVLAEFTVQDGKEYVNVGLTEYVETVRPDIGRHHRKASLFQRIGYPLHCRVRYFDAERRRAGIPEDTAALVERMTADETEVVLVNLDADMPRELIVQGGAYGEHQILRASVDGNEIPVDGRHVSVRIDPGCGGRLRLTVRRYANQPTFAFPWTSS